MRKKIVAFFLLLFSFIKVFATEQIPDLLIIGQDTFYLKSFPLEDLRIRHRLNSPFDYNDYDILRTDSYRGYIATWQIIENKLMLINVEKVDSISKTLNVMDYFSSVEFAPKVFNGYVHADWYSDTLKQYDFFRDFFNSKRYYLSVDYLKEPNRKVELIFKNGILITNNIISIDSYKEGDILTKEISYYRHWLLKHGLTKVAALIAENDGKMVRVKILDYGTTNRFALREIKRIMSIQKDNEYWINPRYWDKKNE